MGSFRGQTHPLLRLVATLSAGRNRVKLHEKVDLGVLGVVLGGSRVVLGGNWVVSGANSPLTKNSSYTLCW